MSFCETLVVNLILTPEVKERSLGGQLFKVTPAKARNLAAGKVHELYQSLIDKALEVVLKIATFKTGNK